MKLARAAIFDMDGVLIDTVSIHEKCWEILSQRIGQSYSHDLFMSGNGVQTVSILMNIFRWAKTREEANALHTAKKAIFNEYVDKHGIKPIPGIEAFLIELQELGVPCAVGTSASRETMEKSLSVVGLKGYFQAIVTAEEIVRGKPAPDVFLKAAEHLNMPPVDCIVFEDAEQGILAGKAAGMRVVALATTHPKSDLAGADMIIDSFEECNARLLFR